MFRIKICGVTRPEDYDAVLNNQSVSADAIGFNFYKRSTRYVDPEQAWEIRYPKTGCFLGGKRWFVGVFVNSSVEEIIKIVSRVSLNAVQLHGDEPSELLAELPARLPIIRARRMDDRGVAPIAECLEADVRAGRRPDALLIDAAAPGEYGGTGKKADWSALAGYQSWLGDTPLILAGGLTTDNVGQAIRTVRPHGVDVASGVEQSPGIKCQASIKTFISQARSAFLDTLAK